MHVVQPRHLLVTGLWVQAHHVGVLQLIDEGNGVTDGWEQDVSAWLIGLGFDSEAQVVALVDHVLTQQIDPFLVSLERITDVLGGVHLRAFAPTPHHVGGHTELGRIVDIAPGLGNGQPSHVAVVGREGTILEHRVGEQVGRHHRGDHSRSIEGRSPLVESRPSRRVICVESNEVVVVEGHAPGAELGQSLERLHGIQGPAGRITEGIPGLPAHGPQAERELVRFRRLDVLRWRQHVVLNSSTRRPRRRPSRPARSGSVCGQTPMLPALR